MTLAPNETAEQYKRKIYLMDKAEKTLDELLELRELTANAISHLTIRKV